MREPGSARALALVLISAVVILAGEPAGAGGKGGPVLIDQTKALRGGVTPGDLPGFPVTLSLPGSYQLAGNLVVSDEDTDAIFVSTRGVAVDLAGFSISGPTLCGGTPPVCAPTGDGEGINGASDITVRNGTIRGMGGHGVLIFFAGAYVENVRTIGNGVAGIEVGSGALVRGNTSRDNGQWGILAANGSLIIGNTVRNNGLDGLNLGVNDGYVNNVITLSGDDEVEGGLEMDTNLCGGDTTCP